MNCLPRSEMHSFDNIILDFMKEQQIPGCAFALSYQGNCVYKQAYGKASSKREVQPDSLFRIASISKTLTAIGILKLLEQEKIKLSSIVFGPKGILSNYRRTSKGDRRLHQITVQQLLEHSAGWDRDQVGDAVFWDLHKVVKKKKATAQDTTLHYMMNKKLQFSPGKRHSYSNLGYLVLGKVIEKITGFSYENHIKDLLRPLGIENMVTGSNSPTYYTKDEVEYFHNPNPSEPNSSEFPENAWMSADSKSVVMDGTAAYGGWVVTTSDLLRIFDSLAGYAPQRLLKPETFQLMSARPSYEHGSEWYGLGIDVEDNGKSWGHTGAMEGTSCTVMHDKSGLTWALYFNAWSKDMDLNGLIKYALSTVSSLPLRQQLVHLPHKYITDISEDQTQAITTMLSHDHLKDHVNLMTAAQYQIQWINSYVWQAQPYFNIIWRKDETRNCSNVTIDVKESAFEETVQVQRENGYGVKLLENYILRDELNFVIIFIKQPEIAQKIYSSQSTEAHIVKMKSMKETGFQLVIQSLVSFNSLLIVSSVYEKAETMEETVSWTAITVDNFLFELNRQTKNNLNLAYVKFFNEGENPYVSAIWSSWKKNVYWIRHSVSRYGFLYEVRQSSAKNRSMDFISAYLEDGVINFAAFWPNKQS